MAATRDPGLLRYSLLGPTEVRYDDSTPRGPRRQRLAFAGRQPLKILTILLIWACEHDSAPLPVAELMRLLSTTRQTIYNGISSINDGADNAGFPAIVEKTRGGRLASLVPGQLDIDRFQDLVPAAIGPADSEDLQTTLKRLDEALALWHGDEPLADIDCPEITEPLATYLKDLRRRARDQWCDVNLRLGRPETARSTLRVLVGNDPLNELVHLRLMVAEYRAGRIAAALQVYRDFHARLVEEQGIGPGARLKAVHQRILAGDEDLLRPDAAF